jgi:hypothetical protein
MRNRLFGGMGLAFVCALLSACGSDTPAAPEPAPTPSPAPSAAPTPTPNPGSAGAFACKLPPSSNPSADDFGELSGPSPRVLDRARYHQVVAENLVQAGVCTVIEKEEIAVKNVNDFNEQWNIHTSAGFVRRKYVTTCAPSWF